MATDNSAQGENAGTTLAGGDNDSAGADAAVSKPADAKAAPDAKATDAAAAKPDAKAADAKAKPADAEAFDVKVPEGFIAQEAFEKFKGLAKELGLKADGAQKLVDFQAGVQKVQAEQVNAETEKLHKAWLDSAKADKEFGGADFDKNTQVARKAIEKFGSPELKKFLLQTGLGNHPELVRAFVRVGKAIDEDKLAGSSSGAAEASGRFGDDADLKQRYPTMFKE